MPHRRLAVAVTAVVSRAGGHRQHGAGHADRREQELQGWAASCADDEIQRATREWLRHLFGRVRILTGVPDDEVIRFIATGMMCNVLAATGLDELADTWADALDADPSDTTTGWRDRAVAGAVPATARS